jgi:hypothetical protein
VLGQAGKTGHVDDRKVKFCDYLTKRLGWREAESEAGDGLKPSTLAAEREAIELYFKPGIGHIKLVDLRDEHIRDLYAAMRLLNRPGEDDHPSELLRRLREARASRGRPPGVDAASARGADQADARRADRGAQRSREGVQDPGGEPRRWDTEGEGRRA